MKPHHSIAIVIAACAIGVGSWLVFHDTDDIGMREASSRNALEVASRATHANVGTSDLSAIVGTKPDGRRRNHDPSTTIEKASTDAPAVTATQIITPEMATQIREHLDLLYTNADREALVQGYRDVMQRLPHAFANKAHDKMLARGEYVLLRENSADATNEGGGVRVPIGSGGSKEAFGLVRIHRLDNGDMVETRIELDDLGPDAAMAVEIAWFQSNVGHRK